MVSSVDIRSDHLKIVQDILCTHLPSGVKVWVFGSRATWTTKDSSDLDLAVEGDTPLDFRTINILQDAFEDSSLPYTVDVVDMNRVSGSFRQVIEEHKTLFPVPESSSEMEICDLMNEGTVKLGDLISIKHGYAFPGDKIVSDEQERILITPGHFEIGGGFRHNHKKYFNSTEYNHDFELDPGDLIVTMTDLSKTGDTLGYSAIVPHIPGKILLHNQRIGKITVHSPNLDKRFCNYLLRSRQYRHHVLSTSTGSTVKHTSPTKILDYSFILPLLPYQIAVGNFLTSLDSKIELNQKINQILEEITKAIFKSWFVDFDPVRAKAEGRPTGLPPEISDLFPDEMVESEIGEIPKGWEITTISDLAEVTMGQSPPGNTYNDDGIGLPFYQGSTDFGFRFPSIIKYCSEPKRLARKDDVLLSIRAPVGDLNRALTKCCIGRGLASIHSREGSSSWIFYKCRFLKESFNTFNSEGAVFGSVSAKDLKSLTTIKPPPKLLIEFEGIANPIDDSIRVKTEENVVLTQLRDTLLPNLISGELRVPDAEKFLEKAGI